MKLTDNQKIEIVQHYTNGIEIKDIVKTYGTSYSNIKMLLKRRGIKLRKIKKNRKYNFDEHYFDVIDTEYKAYWLGFIFGDGSVTKNSLRIEINKEDENHLKLFLDNISLNNQIKDTAKNCKLIYANSVHLVSQLNKYGIIENKTYLTKCLPLDMISKNLQRHFIRGLFDADGWICLHKQSRGRHQTDYGFSSYHLSIIQQIQEWIINNSSDISKDSITKRDRNNQKVCQLIISGNNNFIKLTKLIYDDSKIHLCRKKKKIEELIEFINNT